MSSPTGEMSSRDLDLVFQAVALSGILQYIVCWSVLWRVILLCAPQWAVVILVTGATPGGTDWSAQDGGTATAHCVTILMSCRTVTLVSPSTIVITTLSLHPPGHGMGHGTMELCIVWQTYKRKEEGILTIGYMFWCKQWENRIFLSNSLSLCKVEFMLQLAWAQAKSQGSFYDWKL